ncbi:YaiI/YqxD family protein [Bacillus solimangrovi]|uniref:UPF0178 protein BFG57_11790 n=1 Tax=Bacillus solimangrovi TaxID=1305675 RepID=A0A1E5LI00_9BACI|nr:YaiI/YqxD family protein [Bacillus solimangrovi]OEH93712.1 hypothetical protein BFG57_11790 [Bacillus solimangrovi]
MEGCRIERYGKRIGSIFVDADACPVKNDILEIASQFETSVTFVSSYNHMANESIGGKWVYVDTNKEEADLYIMNHVNSNDIAITQDIGLASILLKRHVYVLSPRGKEYEESNIESALFSRYIHAKNRRAGKYGKGPKPFTNEDRMAFRIKLEKTLSKFEGI